DMSALDDVDFIRIPRARYTAQLERLFKEHAVQPRVRVEARTILVAAELAVQGVGVCVVDDISLVALNDPRVVVRHLLPNFEITIGAVYRADESLAFLAQKFLKLCVEGSPPK